MKLTIIPADGAVYKDGYSFSGLLLEGIPANVHALQWDTDSGWIEFVNESEFRKPPNEQIEALPDWANSALVKWEEANTAQQQPVVAQDNQATVLGAQEL